MPYSRPKLSGLYTLSQIKLLEDPSQPHISISPIYIYAILPPPRPAKQSFLFALNQARETWETLDSMA